VIVHDLGDGRLWCINQTSHAQQAEDLCRYWGNAAFAPPRPYGPVLLGIAQHDNGWYEWETARLLRTDGYPMDFVHGPHWSAKIDLWWRGIRRTFDQHPYAGVLVGHHAALLYEQLLARSPHVGAEERAGTETFIAEQAGVRREARRLLGADPEFAAALDDVRIEANTRLLQFGDSSSLRVCMPWAPGPLPNCPVDGHGVFVPIDMGFDEGRIVYDPWPFSVDRFEVSLWGRVLDRTTFADDAEYRAVLAVAPTMVRTWTVERP
jgi:hypothetical protein